MRYRKKPVVIEAHRIGDDGWPDSIWQGVNENKIILHLDRIGHPKKVIGHVEIQTLEGVMRGEVGDWIIRGINGEFYPCKPDIFEKTYEPVADGWRKAQDWENFAKAVLTDWPTGDLEGSVLFDLALKYGMIQEVPGGYNSDQHIDADGICPEEGDPWYEYTFGGEAGPGLYSVNDITKRIKDLEEALLWCSGSADFNEGGVARKGWLKVCAPLLKGEADG